MKGTSHQVHTLRRGRGPWGWGAPGPMTPTPAEDGAGVESMVPWRPGVPSTGLGTGRPPTAAGTCQEPLTPAGPKGPSAGQATPRARPHLLSPGSCSADRLWAEATVQPLSGQGNGRTERVGGPQSLEPEEGSARSPWMTCDEGQGTKVHLQKTLCFAISGRRLPCPTPTRERRVPRANQPGTWIPYRTGGRGGSRCHEVGKGEESRGKDIRRD